VLAAFWVVVFSFVYTMINFLIYTKGITATGQNTIKLMDSIDDYHNLIRGFIFLPLIIALLRVIFPKKLEKLGDYFLLACLSVYNLHSLSQIFLGSCILTLVPHWISEIMNIPSRYEIYVWNPLSVPDFLLLPYYFVQLFIGLWASTRLINLLTKEKPQTKELVKS